MGDPLVESRAVVVAVPREVGVADCVIADGADRVGRVEAAGGIVGLGGTPADPGEPSAVDGVVSRGFVPRLNAGE